MRVPRRVRIFGVGAATITGVSKSGPWFMGIPYTHGLFVTTDAGARTFVANATYRTLWWFHE